MRRLLWFLVELPPLRTASCCLLCMEWVVGCWVDSRKGTASLVSRENSNVDRSRVRGKNTHLNGTKYALCITLLWPPRVETRKQHSQTGILVLSSSRTRRAEQLRQVGWDVGTDPRVQTSVLVAFTYVQRKKRYEGIHVRECPTFVNSGAASRAPR